jgi:Ion channel
LYIGAVHPLTDIYHWGVVLSTLAVISLIIAVHYEVLRNSLSLLPTVSRRRRQRVVLLILIILTTHAIEIWFFGIAYLVLMQHEIFGSISGQTPIASILDYVYYSAMVYTTVGFGDLLPYGPIRFMSGMEALTGLVMITWSASFTFLEMQRDWRIGHE